MNLLVNMLSKFKSFVSNPFRSDLKVGGYFTFEAFDVDGKPLWKEKIYAKNGVTNVGLDNVLNTYFGASAQTTTWYIGLVDNASFSAFAAGDTMASHAGWLESSAYSEGVRQTWGVGASSGQTVTNASPAIFTANGTVTIKGAFLTSNNTKGGGTGILFATGAFNSTQSLTIGQQLNVTYTNTSSGS